MHIKSKTSFFKKNQFTLPLLTAPPNIDPADVGDPTTFPNKKNLALHCKII